MKFLRKGDTVGLAATARFVEARELSLFVKWMESKGLRVKYACNLFERYHQFAGDDAFRAECFQEMLEDDSVSAIWIVRGGYGTTRILPLLNWDYFQKNPKWIIGFSDITLLHLRLASMGIPSIHGDMPARMGSVEVENFESVYQILTCGRYEYSVPYSGVEPVYVSGNLIGGNLSLIVHSIGNPLIELPKESILLVEDIEEYLYQVDRMAHQLHHAGILERVKALFLGGFTDMRDNLIPFGFTVEEIFRKVFSGTVVHSLPFGHLRRNLAFIHHHPVTLHSEKGQIFISQAYA